MTDWRRKQILIVDDEQAILDVIKRIFAKNGHYEVYACGTAVEAGEFVRTDVPDLIISDFDLSEFDNGVDLALSIRQSAKKEIPVIIMSGSPHNRQKAKINGFEFIKKPFSCDELTAMAETSIKPERKIAAQSESLTFGSVSR
jgi:DNA-binding NtrC family response regulator